MIFEGSLDQLVEYVRQKEFVDICTREAIGEWLNIY
jgi:hypothetical protein